MGVSKLVKTDLIFVDPGVEINSTYNRDVLLTEQLLPVTREISGELSSSKTVLLHTEHMNDPLSRTGDNRFHFAISAAPNNPDLKHVDYRILEEMQQRLH